MVHLRKLPLQNITYSLPFISDDLPTLLAVINELHETMPALSSAWARLGTASLRGP